ncbi:uncharacterized protein LOC127241806 [Andrographis paniculata]|uniref:uncharacterized protein LOC127241806 n=1 Tax=Andrographis paniculata TaxID=175694 RepID=UPI0021E98314|nr:uncharacterized protein LOC127241806 [Andrographis paniculata]
MADFAKEILVKPIQYADEVAKLADGAVSFRQDCLDIKAKSEKLAALLRQAARLRGDLYERPTRRIIDDTQQVLEKALTLLLKCRAAGLSRLFTIIPAAAPRKIVQQLDNSVGDVTWLLRVSTPVDDRDDYDYLGGLPPIAANEPILCLIWEQIAALCSGSVEDRADAAASLVSLARDNDRYGKLIIEEGGLPPLLKLAKEGRMEAQEHAAKAIGFLGRDPETVDSIVNSGVGPVFAKILKEGHMKVQVAVAWAVAELAATHRKCQDHFAQNNTIQLLISHLAFETIPESSKYAIVANRAAVAKQPIGFPATTQMHNVVTNATAIKSSTPKKKNPISADDTVKNRKKKKTHHHHLTGDRGDSIKRRELEDPAIKAEMKIMAARALRYLCAGNTAICKSITESRAMLCFAVLVEKGNDEIQYNSAMALMEITAVAEEDETLRRWAFKPTAPAARTVIDQFLKIIHKEDLDLLIPSIQSVGNLARTFRASEARILAPLVKLLDDREPDVMCEAAIALNKFACPENFLNVQYCKAIIDEDGIKHLVPLVYFGEQMVQIPCFVLLCYLAMHVPESDILAKEDVLIVLEWGTKQPNLMQDKNIEALALEGKKRLELFQSRRKGYY